MFYHMYTVDKLIYKPTLTISKATSKNMHSLVKSNPSIVIYNSTIILTYVLQSFGFLLKKGALDT